MADAMTEEEGISGQAYYMYEKNIIFQQKIIFLLLPPLSPQHLKLTLQHIPLLHPVSEACRSDLTQGHVMQVGVGA